MTAKDIRSGMAVLLVATAINNIVVIDNFYEIERGYHNVISNFNSIGVNISYE